MEKGAKRPPLDYIGEVKKFHCYRHPELGEILNTFITIEMEIENITLIRGETWSGNDKVAETQMKISIQ